MHDLAEDMYRTLEIMVSELRKRSVPEADIVLALEMTKQAVVLEEMTKREELRNGSRN